MSLMTPEQVGTSRAGRGSPHELARQVRSAIDALQLDLSGSVVLTEAATGAYVVTPTIAAAAGATHVYAVTGDSRHGTVDDVVTATTALAEELGVGDRITITTERSTDLFTMADIVTNSGHLRPIHDVEAEVMRPGTALSLMFEAWELGAGRVDLDLRALQNRGVLVAGTNERHPRIDVFGYLGLLAVVQLADAGVAAYRSRIALLCGNPFREPMERGLRAAGADLSVAASIDELLAGPRPDALVVAMTPQDRPVLGEAESARIGQQWPGVTITQFWGDIDRGACIEASLDVWPSDPPAPGHMGVLLSRLGPTPIVRLQAGGLKVGQVLRTRPSLRSAADLEYLDVC
jgi:hypothetical protein